MLDILGGSVLVREAQSTDAQAIRDVHLAAFGEEGPVVADLALALIADESARPSLVLVAESEGEIVGSVIFSSVHIAGSKVQSAYILAPLAVAPNVQRMGTGRKLIEVGLSLLRKRGADLVFVLGDPRYYGRYGFSSEHKVRAPFDLPYPEAWMYLPVGEAASGVVEGQLICPHSLNKAEHW
jgi:putative acetyltransferase